jgi:hypothetical protein
VFEAVRTLAPNSLSMLFSVLEGPLQLISDAFSSALTNIACPALSDLTIGDQGFEDAVKTKFPGAETSGSALWSIVIMPFLCVIKHFLLSNSFMLKQGCSSKFPNSLIFDAGIQCPPRRLCLVLLISKDPDTNKISQKVRIQDLIKCHTSGKVTKAPGRAL